MQIFLSLASIDYTNVSTIQFQILLKDKTLSKKEDTLIMTPICIWS